MRYDRLSELARAWLAEVEGRVRIGDHERARALFGPSVGAIGALADKRADRDGIEHQGWREAPRAAGGRCSWPARAPLRLEPRGAHNSWMAPSSHLWLARAS